MNTPSDKPRRPLSYRARAVAHEWGRAEGVFHCSAPHDELGIVHDHRCDSLADAITFAIERDRAERAGTGATRLRDVPEARQELWDLLLRTGGEVAVARRAELTTAVLNAIEAHLRKATPTAPAAVNDWIAAPPGWLCTRDLGPAGLCLRMDAKWKRGDQEGACDEHGPAAPAAPAVEPSTPPDRSHLYRRPYPRGACEFWNKCSCSMPEDGHCRNCGEPRDDHSAGEGFVPKVGPPKVEPGQEPCDCGFCKVLREYDAAHGDAKGKP